MDPGAIFGINVLMSFVASVVIAKLFVWPWLLTIRRNEALIRLVAPHMFLRFIGLSFIVTGVVSPRLPPHSLTPLPGEISSPVFWRLLRQLLLRNERPGPLPVFGYSMSGAPPISSSHLVQGARVQLNPGDLGAGYFIVTAIVPPLLVTHALIFALLAKN